MHTDSGIRMRIHIDFISEIWMCACFIKTLYHAMKMVCLFHTGKENFQKLRCFMLCKDIFSASSLHLDLSHLARL